MASSTNVESSLIGEGSNNADISATPAAVNSPVAPSAANSPETGADLIQSSEISPNRSRSNVESSQIGEESNNGDIPATTAAANSAVVPAALNSTGTGEDLIKSGEITPNGRRSKKQKLDSSSGGDHRKEREEWSDSAIAILLDSFTEKYIALNRSNLRWKDWKVVEELVAEGCDKQSRKSIEQCKNKIDNLKKRYKLETQRMESNGNSSWIWYIKMDNLFGNVTATKSDAVSGEDDDEDDDRITSANRLRLPARHVIADMLGDIRISMVSSNEKVVISPQVVQCRNNRSL